MTTPDPVSAGIARIRNLPTDLLRTFLTVADLAGFTAAGAALGRSQPAVSLQVKRLEELVGVELFQRTQRGLTLTEAGRTLRGYAREMLSLNDEALARLAEPRVEGNVRLGMPYEFASSILPEILGRFAEVYPDVALEVSCQLSRDLRARFQSGELDLAFVARSAEEATADRPEWQEAVVWVGGPRLGVEQRSPLPLVVAPEGCLYRERMTRALDSQCLPWRIVYTSPTLGGIRAGVVAGLGITALAQSTLPEGVRILGPGPRLPALPPLAIDLLYETTRGGAAVRRLVEFMAERLTPERAVRLAQDRLPGLIEAPPGQQ